MNIELERIEPYFKLNLKDAVNLSQAQRVNRKCKQCNKPFVVMGILPGQHVICPECGAAYIVKIELSMKAVIEEVEV